jgi:molybdenum-dependent DNA-binding transcriptional regulator ModE
MDTEITLEKIELVKDRTGVSYKEAKEALEAANGSVVDAIINIEETINMSGRGKLNDQGAKLVEAIKAAVKKGNVTKVIVKKNDEIILNLPVNVGILGTVIAPWAALVGVIAAFGTKCDIELLTDDGRIIDVSEKAGGAFEEVTQRGADIIEDVRAKGADVIAGVRTKAKKAASKEADEDKAEDYEYGPAPGATEDASSGQDDFGEYVSTEADKDDEREAREGKATSRFSGTVERTAKTVLDVVSEAADVAAEAIRKAVGADQTANEPVSEAADSLADATGAQGTAADGEDEPKTDE